MELILHIGAHRTGSTSLERTLAANREMLARDGTAVWGPVEARRLEGFAEVGAVGAMPSAAQAFAASVRRMNARRLVLSEENILGDMPANLVHGRFYPGLRARLAAYGEVFGVAPKRVGLGIREYRSYWLSAHAFTLTRRAMPPIAELRPRLGMVRRGWLDVIADIRAAFPDTEILVWTKEMLPTHVVDVAGRLLDRPVTGLAPLGRRMNRGPLPRYIPALEALRAERPDAGQSEVARVLDLTPAPPPFEPFTGDEIARMATRYAADIAALEDGFAGARLVMFDEEAAAPDAPLAVAR